MGHRKLLNHSCDYLKSIKRATSQDCSQKRTRKGQGKSGSVMISSVYEPDFCIPPLWIKSLICSLTFKDTDKIIDQNGSKIH